MEPFNGMKSKKGLLFLCFLLLTSQCSCMPSSFDVYNFGTEDKIGTDEPEPEGSRDFILWDKDALPVGEFPKQFSICFNMRYQTMDYWSSGQKTILRIFQENVEIFWIRVNHSPPRGTMIINSGTLWSGGLGNYR